MYDKLYGYVDDFRFITEKTGRVFDIYKPLKEAIKTPELFEEEELENIKKTLKKYSKQKEKLFLNPENRIKQREIKYYLISKTTIEKYEYYEKSKSTHQKEIEDYYCYTKEEFINFFEENWTAFQEIFLEEIIKNNIYKNKEEIKKLQEEILKNFKTNKYPKSKKVYNSILL